MGPASGSSATEHFCLKWNNYQTNIVAALGNLKLDEDFVDVSLSVEGRTIKAHKVILSACSDYFKEVFRVRTRCVDEPRREFIALPSPSLFPFFFFYLPLF